VSSTVQPISGPAIGTRPDSRPSLAAMKVIRLTLRTGRQVVES
jgi:hypothetical protein